MIMEEAPKASLDQAQLKIMAGRKSNKNRVMLKQAILYGIDVSKHAIEHQSRKSFSGEQYKHFHSKQAL